MHGRTLAIDKVNESVIDHERTGATNHRLRHEGQAMLAFEPTTRHMIRHFLVANRLVPTGTNFSTERTQIARTPVPRNTSTPKRTFSKGRGSNTVRNVVQNDEKGKGTTKPYPGQTLDPEKKI